MSLISRLNIRLLAQASRPCCLRKASSHLSRKSSIHGFHSTPAKHAAVKSTSSELEQAQNINPQTTMDVPRDLTDIVDPTTTRALLSSSGKIVKDEEIHHLHVYTHKHNTHIALTKPNNDTIISKSAGNIGLRKASRGTHDAAFQLAAYILNQIKSKNLQAQIRNLEVILRGFGPGRNAVVEVLLGNEGKYIRGKIVKVSDATRLKFGGVRSRKPRRLG